MSLFREHSSRTNDMVTIEYATFRYDTVEVESGPNTGILQSPGFVIKCTYLLNEAKLIPP